MAEDYVVGPSAVFQQILKQIRLGGANKLQCYNLW